MYIYLLLFIAFILLHIVPGFYIALKLHKKNLNIAVYLILSYAYGFLMLTAVGFIFGLFKLISGVNLFNIFSYLLLILIVIISLIINYKKYLQKFKTII